MQTMLEEQNKSLTRRLFDEDLNEGNQDARFKIANEIVAPDFVDHTNPPGMQQGIENHKQIVTILRAAFPDLHWDFEDLVAEGDKVAIRITMHGTHQGEFFGIPPTGKPVAVSGIHIMRYANGKLVEHWGNNNDLGMMQQLGVVPVMT
jgi:predicted ester cyclase